ncbi:deoxyguanosinetriphosphate triphosphohydrolase [Actinotignum urinale]|uniref:Deoxyguanosinetriphosphate triphosphohydrolase-like protein n=1 Tax=Actinotignum urinale TaxID=190146 RepID=A0AAW9HVP9_9ACTO|nr:deoxyguanosinetriphosphate triphosphohydrolase [Actinotignum urinale]MDY5129101.1 deoxyguanosinetriphosphate triphosphohydrolase [Actinotignum urinale]MDY5132289.1 deoxyguanosinetriphosphate triphosphohydrolase [Actinotignum urinale]MDY5151396.1 deoxyguanosinetriphosphate triphosphohydrolase [Actinotignum urinale]MDY5154919.1 deoxyguanosinetriphosphate triphosphohydrolase [Actinotignum urinale]MDY5160826.1 deoxyguanosinetriphosphate triphosphohydrolase [Actinotignum urinale]
MYSDADRQRWVHEPPKSRSRTDFERDRARVLHSSALRRLGAKTQVLGPETDDFVRTRLTHSLEVAQIGRSFATHFGCNPDIVETACLAHDLGHPPFGHNGEQALNDIGKDIGGFEGNAQTLRILTRLEPKRMTDLGRPAGLNLTRATLDAVIKYPWPKGEHPHDPSSPKFNYYEDDSDVYEWIRQGQQPENSTHKCIEAQIMDLSDDIAYSIHDVEDAIVRGFLNPALLRNPEERERIIEETLAWYAYPSKDSLCQAMMRLLVEEAWPTEFRGTYKDYAIVKDLTSDLIGRFVNSVRRATIREYPGEELIRYNGSLVIPQETEAEIAALKGIAVAYVMGVKSRQHIYLEQRAMIFDLVDALKNNPKELEPHLREHWGAADEAGRKRLVIDQVASLTDLSARLWHSRLCGMLRH